MPVTNSRSLTPQPVREIRRLARVVLDNGPSSSKGCPWAMTADALGRFDIVQGGVTGPFFFPTPCKTPAANDMSRSLGGGADPDGRDFASHRRHDYRVSRAAR